MYIFADSLSHLGQHKTLTEVINTLIEDKALNCFESKSQQRLFVCLNLFQLRITNWSTCIVTNPRITESFTDKQNTVSWPWLQHHRSVYWCGMSLYQNNDKDDITRWGRAGSGHWHSPDTAERPRAERETLDSGHDDTSLLWPVSTQFEQSFSDSLAMK